MNMNNVLISHDKGAFMDEKEWHQYATYLATQQQAVYDFVADIYRFMGIPEAAVIAQSGKIPVVLKRAGADLFGLLIKASKHERLDLEKMR